MKLIAAMMLAGAFLISQPAFAGDKPAEGSSEKAPKDKKGDKKDDSKKEEKKAEKGGW